MKYSFGLRTVIGGLILAAAAVPFIHGIRVVYKANVSLRWPTVTGRVVSSGIEKADGEDADVYGVPRIGYGFFVGSDSYFSTRRAFIPAEMERLSAAQKEPLGGAGCASRRSFVWGCEKSRIGVWDAV